MTFKEFKIKNPCHFNCEGQDVEVSCQCYEEYMIQLPKTKHPKCRGWVNQHGEGECDYYSNVACDDCRYLSTNLGKGKDPEAKCNQSK